MRYQGIAAVIAGLLVVAGFSAVSRADHYDIGTTGLSLTYTGTSLTVLGTAGSGFVVNGAPSTTGTFSFTANLVANGTESLTDNVTGGPSVTDSTNLGATPYVEVAGSANIMLTGFKFNGVPQVGTAVLRLPGFNPASGDTTMSSESADLVFDAAPLPSAAWGGLVLLGGLIAFRRVRGLKVS